MKNFACCILLLIVLVSSGFKGFSQPAIQWSKCYGTAGKEMATGMVKGIDNGYIITGYSDSSLYGMEDFFAFKIDDTGKVAWQKYYGGTLGDICSGIIPVRGETVVDDGYLLVGWTLSNDSMVSGNHGATDVWVVKIDLSGNFKWQKCLGGSSIDDGIAAAQTTDGNLVVVSSTESNNGDVTGYHGGKDIWVAKLTQSGNLMWQQALGGSSYDNVFDVRPTFDGGVILAGWTFSNDGDVTANNGSSDGWVVKLSHSGIKQWDKCLGTSDGDGGAFAVVQTSDSGYLVSVKTGLSLPGHTNTIIKLNNIGQMQWVDSNFISPIVPTGNGYIGFGTVMKRIDDTAKMQWGKKLGGSGTNAGEMILTTSDGGYLALYSTNSTDGDVVGNHGDWDFWVVKLAPDQLTVKQNGTPPTKAHIHPNPVSDVLIVYNAAPGMKTEVYSFTGQIISAATLRNSSEQINTSALPAGIYLLRLTSINGVQHTLRFVKQ